MKQPFSRLIWSLCGAAVFLPGCSQSSTPLELTSLRQSGRVSFVCVGPDREGAPLTSCPQGPIGSTMTTASLDHTLYALVTQSATGEVAVVRVTPTSSDPAQAVDTDASIPGITALRVGLRPEDIVTTPGGLATFVGSADASKPGIFGLSTSCIFPPQKDADGNWETQRDFTTWPACSLSSLPGEMLLMADPLDSEGRMRATCDGPYEALVAPGLQKECQVDLNLERGLKGRLKLLVTLPKEGKLVVVDAQSLLSREPGTFRACPVEREIALSTAVPSAMEAALPSDLEVPACGVDSRNYGPFVGPFQAQPANLATDNEGLVVVGDRGTPLVHLLRGASPCSLAEGEPLVATSFSNPSRLVTTSEVAVSPPLLDGSQYVYAVDEVGERVASLMAFAVQGPEAARTPIVRPRSRDMRLEPPDRIQFSSAVKDVAFIRVDEPLADEDTSVGSTGVQCDPDPGISSSAPEALLRADAQLTTGAGAGLRGTFAYILTSDGRVNLVDVEDYDAACRRPATANASSVADFRGCKDDPADISYYSLDETSSGTLTVTNEASCQTVERHRARSWGAQGYLLVDETKGIGAPSLAALPRLSKAGRGFAVSRATIEGRKNPILLGVDFEKPGGGAEPAQVHVGSNLLVKDDASAPLVIDPNLAEQANLVLPVVEPRAYPQSEVVSVSYEGDLAGTRRGGVFEEEASDPSTIRLVDADARFCDAGTQDEALTAQLANVDFALTGEPMNEFGVENADYVQITSALLPESDPYWSGDGAQCLNDTGFQGCDAVFGDVDIEDLRTERDLRVIEAYQGQLLLTPRVPRAEGATRHLQHLRCCFPQLLSYRVRAGRQWVVRGQSSGFVHPVAVDGDGGPTARCVLTCDPVAVTARSRVFELSSNSCDDPDPEADNPCGVGPSRAQDRVCTYDAARGPVELGSSAARCIHSGPTRRFAIYRGLEPSRRDMVFGFQVSGGFNIYSIPLVSDSTSLLPVSLRAVPEFRALGVVDSQSRGLLMIDLRTSRTADSFY